MKRNALLITTALFCLATSALAAEGKKDAQLQPQPTEQTQMAQTGAETPKDQASPAGCDCKEKVKKHSKQKHQPSQPQNEPQPWQPEYGAGG